MLRSLFPFTTFPNQKQLIIQIEHETIADGEYEVEGESTESMSGKNNI